MATDKEQLPGESNDQIIEVSLKHVIFTFGSLVLGSITVGASVTFIKDYVKYRRQKALFDAVKNLITFLNNGGNFIPWNDETTGSSFPKAPSKNPKKS